MGPFQSLHHFNGSSVYAAILCPYLHTATAVVISNCQYFTTQKAMLKGVVLESDQVRDISSCLGLECLFVFEGVSVVGSVCGLRDSCAREVLSQTALLPFITEYRSTWSHTHSCGGHSMRGGWVRIIWCLHWRECKCVLLFTKHLSPWILMDAFLARLRISLFLWIPKEREIHEGYFSFNN